MELKEIKFRPKTDDHDMNFKVKHVRRFLEEGNKCRLVIVFRGREVVHPKTGVAVLDRVVEACSDIGQVEVRPNLEGKRMIMIIGPKAGVARRSKENKDSGKAKAQEPAASSAPASEDAQAAAPSEG
jgi:translation initiation factor IF-3